MLGTSYKFSFAIPFRRVKLLLFIFHGTLLEPTDKNDEVKKGIMNAILMDEIVNSKL